MISHQIIKKKKTYIWEIIRILINLKKKGYKFSLKIHYKCENSK
jgi:hypothetical protein